MEDMYLKRKLTLNLKFETRNVKLEFKEPTIFRILKFSQYVKNNDFIKGIKSIIPCIDEKDFISNPQGIISATKTLIFGEQRKISGVSMEDGDDREGFFPSSLDIIGNRYGILPTELIKKLTFTQLMICIKGYEWNLNIQNGKENENIGILVELEKNNGELEKYREKAEKDREFFKKFSKNIEKI